MTDASRLRPLYPTLPDDARNNRCDSRGCSGARPPALDAPMYPNVTDDADAVGCARETFTECTSPHGKLGEPPIHALNARSHTVSSVFSLLVSIVLFFTDVVTDIWLAHTLYMQAESEKDTDAAHTTRIWFIITVVIIVLPMVVINCFSLLWYYQNKQCLGDYCVLHKIGICKKVFITLMHLLLMGTLMRNIDQLYYGFKIRSQFRTVAVDNQSRPVKRLTPKGEVYAVEQMVIARDSAMLDMLHSFLQDAPQLIFQIFLLYRSPTIISEEPLDSLSTVTTQMIKIFLAIVSMAFSLVKYQDELRRTISGKPSIGVSGNILCMVWRVTMLAARVISIASFGALMIEDSPKLTHSDFGWLGYEKSDPIGEPLTYPVISCIIFGAHWLLMTVWIHAQKSNFCGKPATGEPRPCAELLYSVVMGWVHIFCFVNHRPTPARLRMLFFYTLTFVENSALIAFWFYKVITVTEIWFRIIILCSVEGLFILGLSAIITYYTYVHPTPSPQDEMMHFNL